MKKQMRKIIRLEDFDYSQNGAYFITVCVKERANILSRIVPFSNDISIEDIGYPMDFESPYVPVLTQIGEIVRNAILSIPDHYENVMIDDYVIMPDHVHLIVYIYRADPEIRVPSISQIINQTKGYITRRIDRSIWQTRFYDHVIRNKDEYDKMKKYIATNPAKKYFEKMDDA